MYWVKQKRFFRSLCIIQQISLRSFQCHIVFLSTPVSPKWPLSFTFPPPNPVHTFPLPRSCHTPCPSHKFNHLNAIWWAGADPEVLVMRSRPGSCYVFPLWPQVSSSALRYRTPLGFSLNMTEQLLKKSQLDALFILTLVRQSTSTCFGHICSPLSGGILYIYTTVGTYCAF